MSAWTVPALLGMSLATLLAATPTRADPPASPPPALPAASQSTPAVPPDAEQILAIPPPLMTLLRHRVIEATPSREQRLEKLVHLIFDEDGMHLEYDPYATHTLTETWQTRRANCLSFTLLFVALARAAGIEARVQEVAQVMTWYQDEGVIYSVGHVNAGVTLNGRTADVDLDRNVLYDRYGPRPITGQRALAHFYNNRGAQAMAAGDLAKARTYLQAALRQSPQFTPGWNNLGVLDVREGRLAQAQQDFQTALRLQPRHAAALTNASALYTRLGEPRLAGQLAHRLRQVERKDPFAQFRMGNQAEERRDYADAIRFYRKAIALYGSAHQFHFGLARAYFLAGDSRRASQEMQRARDLADEDASVLRAAYQAKLDSLKRWQKRTAAN